MRVGGRLVCSAALVCVALGLGGAGVAAAANALYVTADLGAGEGTGVRGFAIREDGTLVPAAQPLTAVGDDAEGMAATPDGRYLYVADAGSNRLFGFAIGADGALSPVAGSPLPTGGLSLGALAVTPDGQWLYAIEPFPAGVSGYRIGGDGELTPVRGGPAPTGTDPVAMVASPDSRHLYVTNRGSDNISGFTIGADGALTPVEEHGRRPGGEYPTWSTGHEPVAIATSVPNRDPQIYVANHGSGNVSTYTIVDDGELVPSPGSPVPTGARGIDPSGLAVAGGPEFGGKLYVATEGNFELAAPSVLAFRILPRSNFVALDPLPGLPAVPLGAGAGLIAVSPDGRWLFTASRTSRLSVFEIVNDSRPFGRLKEVEHSPLRGWWEPRAFAVVTPPSRCAGRSATAVATSAAPFRATSKADVVVGDAAGNRIDALGGADLACAAGGADLLAGGGGNDRLYGQGGRDRLPGGPGADRIDGGLGTDRIAGGPGNDRIVSADAGRDVVDCGPGRDLVIADRRDRLRRCERIGWRLRKDEPGRSAPTRF